MGINPGNPVQPPTPSASGKTLALASTHGNQRSGIRIDGKDVFVGVSTYVYADPKR